MRKYMDLFVSETREHLEEAAEAMVHLEQHPHDEETLNLLFRHGHSIKGMAGSMGFEPIARLSHALEDLFDQVRNGHLRFTPEIADHAFQALDALGDAITAAERGEDPPANLEQCGTSLRSFLESPPPAAQPSASRPHEQAPSLPAPAIQGDLPAFNAEIKIAPNAAMPAARALVLFKKLEGMGRILFSSPSKEAILAGQFEGTLLVQFATNSPEASLRQELEGPEVQSLALAPCAPTAPPGAAKGSASPSPAARSAEPAVSTATLRIRTEVLDRFLDHLGELIIHENRLKNSLGEELPLDAEEALENLHKTLDRLQGDLMSLRMMPFEHIAPRFARTVRNLGSNLGKRVALTIDGRDVELDRSILEGIVDPINHMLRNAVDHGIETAQERVARGKPSVGRISICSTAHGDAVTLEIVDDGRGMDPQRIRQVAVERQLLSRDEADALEDAEVLMLVTTPGFSTAERLTEVSGRGVGMDVVRTRIESLGGRLKIHSTPGKGTRIVLRLPLSIAMIHGFLVQADGNLYAVPVSSVARTVAVELDSLETEGGEMWLRTEEGRIQMHSLAALMNGNGLAKEEHHKRPVPALLFHCDDRTRGILVDAVLGKRDMVVKPLHSPLENLREYSGATILEEGRIALILDLQNLIAGG